jgi:hypothetical protein
MSSARAYANLDEVIEAAKAMTVNGFIMLCHTTVFDTTYLQDAPVDTQRRFLRYSRMTIRDSQGFENEIARSVFKKATDTTITTILVERGEKFIYQMDPILTIDGKPLPRVTVIDLSGNDAPVVLKSSGSAFNDINTEIWMETLMLCCRRRGYRRISDVMHGDVMSYVQHGRISIVKVYKKEPNLTQNAMRLSIPPSAYVPYESTLKKLFYNPMDKIPQIMPREALSGPQLVYSIVQGLEKGHITRGTSIEKLAYYEHSLYNYVRKYPGSGMRRIANEWLRIIVEWTS